VHACTLHHLLCTGAINLSQEGHDERLLASTRWAIKQAVGKVPGGHLRYNTALVPQVVCKR
jgi:hypothetical protein